LLDSLLQEIIVFKNPKITMDLSCVKSKNLMEAVQKNRQEEILTRLRLGEKVDAIFTVGRTALHCAAANSNIEAVSTLLMYSPNVKICDANGNTALHIACSRNGPEAVQIIEKLVSSGAELNNVNKWKRTALHECVISNNINGAKMILEFGANKEVIDSDGRTAGELACSRNSIEMIELLVPKVKEEMPDAFKEDVEDKTGVEIPDSLQLGACALPKKMTVEEEKEVLRRRLAELEEGETKTLESNLKDKKNALDRLKIEYRNQRELARSEIFKLEQKIKVLQNEEEKKTVELEKEIEKIASEIDKKRKVERPDKNKDIESCLECPVCLDVCKPPLQVWQCPEGHIICESCVDRPELRVCPQCRISLTGQLSRNRALEDLARKAFPREAEKEAKNRNRGAGGGRGRNSERRPSRRVGEGGRRAAQVQSQVDQLINFSHLGMEYMDSEFDDDSYDLTSELFLENVDDEFMPNFPSSLSPLSAWRESPQRYTSSRNSALIQRINSMRLRNSPGTGRRRSSPESYSDQRPRLLPSSSDFMATDSISPSNSPTRRTRSSTTTSNNRNSDQALYGPHGRGRGGRFRRNNTEQRLSSSRHLR